jgi:hypothetical protein
MDNQRIFHLARPGARGLAQPTRPTWTSQRRPGRSRSLPKPAVRLPRRPGPRSRSCRAAWACRSCRCRASDGRTCPSRRASARRPRNPRHAPRRPRPQSAGCASSTDVLDLEISPRGGDLVKAVLPRYPVHKNQPERAGAVARSHARQPLRATQRAEHGPSRELDARGHKLQRRGCRVPPRAGPGHAGSPAQRASRGWRDGHQDLPLPPRQLRRGTRTAGQQRGRGAVVRRELPADPPAARPAGPQHDQRRELLLSRPGRSTARSTRSSTSATSPRSASSSPPTAGWVASIQHHFLTAAMPGGNGRNSPRPRVPTACTL